MKYDIQVRYRTNSGCNAKLVTVEAETVSDAFAKASDKVRRMRGVIKIDGGDWHEPSPWKNHPPIEAWTKEAT